MICGSSHPSHGDENQHGQIVVTIETRPTASAWWKHAYSIRFSTAVFSCFLLLLFSHRYILVGTHSLLPAINYFSTPAVFTASSLFPTYPLLCENKKAVVLYLWSQALPHFSTSLLFWVFGFASHSLPCSHCFFLHCPLNSQFFSYSCFNS